MTHTIITNISKTMHILNQEYLTSKFPSRNSCSPLSPPTCPAATSSTERSTSTRAGTPSMSAGWTGSSR